MKIKYSWLVLAITAIASLGLSVWRSVVIEQGGEFFLDKSMYSIIIFGIIIFAFIVGAILTVLDRETPQTYNIDKNFFAGFFGLLISICYITDGALGFMEASSVTEYNKVFYIIVKVFELAAGGVFLMESISSLIGKNLFKNKPMFTVIVPVMFALRLIVKFFDYTKVSVQSSEMFDIVAIALASLFMYYHAVMFSGIKKSCVKSMFFFGVPMICASLVSGTDIVVSAVLAGKFTISTMIMTVSDVLLCFYAISLLAEMTHKAGKQYLKEVVDGEPENSLEKEEIKESEENIEQTYNSFEDIASFGKAAPHIRRETIISEPAANTEPKMENPEVASHADALHSKLQSNFEQQIPVEEPKLENEPVSEPAVSVNNVDDSTLSDINSDIKSEPIPEPTSNKPSYTPTTDGVDMDRINRLLLELENDDK